MRTKMKTQTKTKMKKTLSADKAEKNQKEIAELFELNLKN
jgi:hypothetical protein